MRKNWIEKTAARLARPAVRKASRITLRPRSAKSWLMGGTALFGGVLAASVLWSTDEVLAACSAGGNSFTCANTETNPFTFTPSGAGDGWVGIIHGTVDLDGNTDAPGNEADISAKLTIDNTTTGFGVGDWTGHVDMYVGSQILIGSGGTGPGIELLNDAPVDSTVTFNLAGHVESQVNSGVTGDAMRLQGYNIIVNLQSEDGEGDGQIIGEDDGIRFVSGRNHVTVNNYGGLIWGKGNVTGDEGFGIEYDGGGTTGAWNRLGGDVTILNEDGGIIRGGKRTDVGFTYGSGITIATTGDTDITNESGSTIDGFRGIWIQQATDGGQVAIYNDGDIKGTSDDAIYVATHDSVYLRNSSIASIVGGLNGFDVGGGSQVVLDNHDGTDRGLLAGLGGNGADIENISGSGLDIHDLPLVNTGNAVDVDNRNGSVITGLGNGLYINNVFGDKSGESGESGDAANVFVDNSGSFNGLYASPEWNPGGLIAGVNEDGVHISNVIADTDSGTSGNGGAVTIINDLTRQTANDLASLDDAVYDTSGGGSGLLFGVLPDYAGPYGTSMFTVGIYGFEDGVDVSNVDDYVWVSNRNGQIVGEEGMGVRISGVGSHILNADNLSGGINVAKTLGGVLIDNSAAYIPNLHGSEEDGYVGGGTIWGGQDGLNVSNVWGEAPDYTRLEFALFTFDPSIVVNNDFGLVTGQHNGGVFSESWELTYSNFGGTTVGSWGDGIRTNSIQKVGIYNGANWNEDFYHQGFIIGGDTAIDVWNSEDAFVLNLEGGNIIGDGQPDQPVMSFNTWINEEDGLQTLVLSAGLMTSQRNPNFDRNWSPLDVNEPLDFSLDTAQIADDAFNIAAFAASGGSLGDISSIESYALTSSDLLMYSEGGAAALVNVPYFFGSESEGEANGIMFGRVQMFGSSAECYSESECGVPNPGSNYYDVGNTVVNASQWFVTNQFYYNEISESDEQDGANIKDGTILQSYGDGQDAIFNFGATHTGFGNNIQGGTYTSFVLDTFYNGGNDYNLTGYLPVMVLDVPSESSESYSDGLLSMVNNFAGEVTEDNFLPYDGPDPKSYTGDVTQIFGDFFGSYDNSLYRSYLAIDAYLDVPVSEGGKPAADLLIIGEGGGDGESGYGLSGSTGVILNATGPSGLNTEGILFAVADRVYGGEDCFYTYCKDGDPFYMAAGQPGYAVIDGVGARLDTNGLYAWFIEERPAPGNEHDPDFFLVSAPAPSQDQAPSVTTGAVNIMSSLFDLVWEHVRGYHFPVNGGGGGADLALAPDANKKGIWLRASGSWANQDTHVTQGVLDIDTSFNQNIYSILGGGDFSPNGDGPGMRYGVFGGYVTSKLNFDSYSASVSYSGGVVGGYAAYNNASGFYADAQLSGDFLKATFAVPFLTAKVDVNSVGVLANVGKRFDRGRFFVEPIASAAWIHTSVSGFSSGGTTVDYSNGESFRVGVGGRIGTNVKLKNGKNAELSLLGKVWDELSGDNTITVSDGVNTATFVDHTGGIYGEVSATATLYNDARTMSGFVSGGAQFNGNGTIWNAKVGARKAF